MSRLGRMSIRRLLSEKLISIDEHLTRDECLRNLNNHHVKFYHGRIGSIYAEKLLLDHHKKFSRKIFEVFPSKNGPTFKNFSKKLALLNFVVVVDYLNSHMFI